METIPQQLCEPSQESVFPKEELRSLELLRQSIYALATSIQSIGGPTPQKLIVRYIFWTASLVKNTAHGFVKLKELGLMASKLLVRPCLEGLFNATAAVKSPNFLFEKTCDEWREENKYFPNDVSSQQEAEAALDQIKLEFGSTKPNDAIRRAKLSVFQAAEQAEMTKMYLAYRIYCQYTHGAIRSAIGDLDSITDLRDTSYVNFSVLGLLRLLKENCDAAADDLEMLEEALVSHFNSLTKD